MYADEDMLMLSGIQHFVFCPRQWALIHIDGCWAENYLTAHGRLLHARVDDAQARASLNGVVTMRHVPIASYELGLYGVTDAVELAGAEMGWRPGRSGKLPEGIGVYPVEYKRGHKKTDLCDVLQLTAQAMCLEEMLGRPVATGALFYWETRRREEIEISEDLRATARQTSATMHSLFRNRELPERQPRKGCRGCSLKEECQPELRQRDSATRYIKKFLYAEDA